MAPKALLNRLLWDSAKEIGNFVLNLWMCVLGLIIYFIGLAFTDFSPLALTVITSAFCFWTSIYLPAGDKTRAGFYLASIPFFMWLFYAWIAAFLGPFTWLFFLGILLYIIDKVLDQNNQPSNEYSPEWVYRDRRVIYTLSAWMFIVPLFVIVFISIGWLIYVFLSLILAIFISPPTNAYIAAIPTLIFAGICVYTLWGMQDILKFSRPKFNPNIVSSSNYIDAFDNFEDPLETIDPKLQEIMEGVSKEDSKKIVEALEAASKDDYSLITELSSENAERCLDLVKNSMNSK